MIYVKHAATQVEWTENGTFMNWVKNCYYDERNDEVVKLHVIWFHHKLKNKDVPFD